MSKTLSPKHLFGRYWRISHNGHAPMTENLLFLPDGKIGLYDHPYQRRWLIENGTLCLTSESGEVTSRFEKLELVDGKMNFSGPLLPRPERIVRLSELGTSWTQYPGTTKEKMADQIRRYKWTVGDHTYGVPTIGEAHRAKLTIGKYSSIAGGVTIMLANHRTDTVSTYPFSFLRNYWPSCPDGFADHEVKGDVEIGNDVWIGSDVFIGSGVKIGNGAVIGAKSVVTKDVPHYAVVVGTPAKLLRYRFSEAIIKALLSISWWDWPDEVVNQNLPLMMSTNIEAFIANAQHRNQASE